MTRRKQRKQWPPKPKTRRIPDWLFDNFEECCFYCAHAVFRPKGGPDDGSIVNLGELGLRGATRDHVVPRAHGGTNHADNLVLACEECNALKGTRTQDNFRIYFAVVFGRGFYGDRALHTERDWLPVCSPAFVKSIVAHSAAYERQGYE